MTNEPDNDRPDDGMAESENTLNEYDQIQKRLGEGFDDDPRLSSGVPQEERGSDIEFIQMSGLVRPTAPSDAAAPPVHEDLDASRPVSFFEKGVADVDADMVPGSLEDRSVANQEIQPVQQTQAAMSHLRDIIADLTKDETPAAPTDPDLMAALDGGESADEAPSALPPAPAELAATPEAPVSLDDMLSEFAPTHPMQAEAEARVDADVPAPAPAPVQPEQPVPDEAARATAPEAVDAAAAPDAKPVTRVAPSLPGHSARLAEAEKLLEELEPATVAPDGATAFDDTAHEQSAYAVPSAPTADVANAPGDAVLDYKRQSKRRHRSPGNSRVARSLVRLAAGLLLVSALAVATFTGYLWIQQRMASPGQMFNQAARLASKGDLAAASQMFEDFASLHPNNPLRADAQFNAAFTMQQQRPPDNDSAQEVTRQALRLFEQFCKDNPTHPKVARAETLMGRLNFESGRYAEAIELLRNPELRLRDPASAVPTLRTLARASAKMGDAEAARSYYLQAVGVQGNLSPDVDYAELGSLYQSRADHAEDLDRRIELQQLAIESWTHALEVPGIDPASKSTIRSQLDVLHERLQNEPGMAPAMESLDVGTEPVDDEPAAQEGDEFPAADHPAVEPAAPSDAMAPASETAASSPETHGAPGPHEQHDAEVPAAPAAPNQTETVVAQPSETAAGADGEYVVQHGDSLVAIADKHQISVEALKELNALSGDKVFEGQHLIVPGANP